jgi:hypothetical protein
MQLSLHVPRKPEVRKNSKSLNWEVQRDPTTGHKKYRMLISAEGIA